MIISYTNPILLSTLSQMLTISNLDMCKYCLIKVKITKYPFYTLLPIFHLQWLVMLSMLGILVPKSYFSLQVYQFFLPEVFYDDIENSVSKVHSEPPFLLRLLWYIFLKGVLWDLLKIITIVSVKTVLFKFLHVFIDRQRMGKKNLQLS